MRANPFAFRWRFLALAMRACDWVAQLAEQWVMQAQSRGQRALEMYERDLKSGAGSDEAHRRALKHIANAFYDEGLEAKKQWQKSAFPRKDE